MLVRIFFVAVAVILIIAGTWAHHHDRKLERNAALVNLGDPNETVRELMGDPTREEACGRVTLAPQSCGAEYVYRFYFSIFRPQYQVVWFDHAGRVIGEQHLQRP
jgi:hypothetical protein